MGYVAEEHHFLVFCEKFEVGHILMMILLGRVDGVEFQTRHLTNCYWFGQSCHYVFMPACKDPGGTNEIAAVR